MSGILLAALVAALFQLVLHWFPWRMALRRDALPRIAAYVLGVLGIGLPLTGLYYAWESWEELAALWTVIVISGIAVILSHVIDLVLAGCAAPTNTRN